MKPGVIPSLNYVRAESDINCMVDDDCKSFNEYYECKLNDIVKNNDKF